MDGQERLTLLLAMVIVVAFFMPWITVESGAVGSISQLLTGKNQPIVDSISGARVPLLANSKESRLIISVIKVFNPDIRKADKKSYLLWCVPLIAIVIALAGRVFRKVKYIRLFLGIVCITIVCAVTYKFLSTDLAKLMWKVNIVYGLWMTLFGFFTIGALEIASFLALQTKPKEAKADKVRSSFPHEDVVYHKKKFKIAWVWKTAGALIILFTISADWLKWGLVSGFSSKQAILIGAGITLMLYGFLFSKGPSQK